MDASGAPFDAAPASPPDPSPLLRPTVSAISSRPFSMAFQPIVDVEKGRTVAYEALVRGPGNEPAATIFSASRTSARNSIDRACRLTAIEVASSLELLATGADLAINVNASAASSDIPSLAATVAAADRAGLPLHRLILEISEQERLRDPAQLENTVRDLRACGLRIAIDDFGAGFAGLGLLAAFHPDIIKIDIALVRDIHLRRSSRVIVRAILDICHDLNIQLVAEGIESACEQITLQDLGVRFMQGHHFAEPAFEALPAWPAA